MQDFTLSKVLRATCEEWLANCAKQGFTYRSAEDVHVYGPYPSRSRFSPIIDAEALMQPDWNPFAIEKDESPSAFSMYMLVANFDEKQSSVPERGLLLTRS